MQGKDGAKDVVFVSIISPFRSAGNTRELLEPNFSEVF